MDITGRLRALARLVVQPASAHCDTEDGPVVTAGRRALLTGNVNHALAWVPEADEAEVRDGFAAARTTSGDELAAAEHRFLETLVRLHRAGEGAGFTGIKPSGTPWPAAVTAADRALAEGSTAVLEPLVEAGAWPDVSRRFVAARALRNHDVDDVATGRRFVAAYVAYVHHALHHASSGAVPSPHRGE
jgi:hypothetical protein